MADLPAGTVTFLFTDVEGSTRLLAELGPEAYAAELQEHRRVVREAVAAHAGVEVDTQGDAFCIAFARASDALAAAESARRSLDGRIRARMGVHTGEPLLTEERYIGMDVHRAARIAAAGHGGQIVVSQTTRDLVGRDDLVDLGEHRLKDLATPERLWQLGDGEFPPLSSLGRTNLVPPTAPLLGRDRELADVLDLLETCRFVTLTGAGGIGKTRLALAAAAGAADRYPGGVFVVALAERASAEEIPDAVAAATGSATSRRDALLVLDNVEHLLPAAAGLVTAIDGTILSTSRERLGLHDEHVYDVGPLATPAARALFVERGRRFAASLADDAEVANVAELLGGHPLALELAAARVDVLSVRQIAERVGDALDVLRTSDHDVPERQRTIRAALDWSRDLLTEEERRVFASLGVFPASFDLDAAERVTGAGLEDVASLVRKSLLTQSRGRISMLEPVREYAREQRLASADAAQTARAHADHYEALCRELAPRLDEPDGSAALERLALELPNVRAAIELLLTEDRRRAGRIVVETARFWWVRAPIEAHRLLRRAYEEPDEGLDDPTLRAVAGFALLADDLDRVDRFGETRLANARRRDDTTAVVGTLVTLAHAARGRGDLARVGELDAEAERLARATGDDRLLAHVLQARGERFVDDDAPDQALPWFEEALAAATRLRAEDAVAHALEGVGIASCRLRRWQTARDRLERALVLHTNHGDLKEAAVCFDHLAVAMHGLGDPAAARRLFAEGDAAWEEIGVDEEHRYRPPYVLEAREAAGPPVVAP